MATAELNGTEHETEAATETPAPAPPRAETEAEEKLREIREMTAEIEEASADHYRKAEAAKAAKKRVEAMQADLLVFIRRSQEKLPLFDKQPAAAPPAVESEAWRSLPIEALKDHGLPAAIVGKLEIAELLTLGAVQDWIATGKRLTDIDGIGGAKAEQIEDAFMRFWEANPGAAAEADAKADESDGADEFDGDSDDDDEEAA